MTDRGEADAGVPAGAVTEGHCLCRAVAWRYRGRPAWVAHCHCESCRRTCSAPIVTFVGVPRAALEMTGAAPRAYVSSPGVRRLFCGTCGAPVAYDSDAYPEEIHLYAAGHAEPGALAPSAHVFHTEALPWLPVADGLKRYDGAGAEPEGGDA